MAVQLCVCVCVALMMCTSVSDDSYIIAYVMIFIVHGIPRF